MDGCLDNLGVSLRFQSTAEFVYHHLFLFVPQGTSEFRYDHSVCTYSLHIVYTEKAAEQYCHWKAKSESIFCEVLLIALAA